MKIEGGTFVSNRGLAVKMLSDDSADGEKEIVITGGTFSTDVKGVRLRRPDVGA